jgi:hypothetical protein
MAYGGLEKNRQSLKYRCPARHYGYDCEGQGKCPVKRVNSRLDVSFGFEQQFIRGLAKMKLRCSLALCDVGHGLGKNPGESETPDAQSGPHGLKRIRLPS